METSAKKSRKPHKKAYRIGPYTRATQAVKLDHRTREARVMRSIATALREHVGEPSLPEQLLIETSALLWTQICLLSPAVMRGEAEGDHADRQLLAYVGTLRRNLEALGLKAPGPSVPSLTNYLEGKAA